MNKLVLIGALMSVFGVAHADDAWKVKDKTNELNSVYKEYEVTSYSKNYFDVSVGVTSGSTTVKDEEGTSKINGTGYNVGIAYTSYQTQNLFLQPSLQYLTTGNESGDKYVLGKLDIGYTHTLSNGITLSPKAGVGVYKVNFDGGSNYGIGYNAGLEVGVSKNVAIDLGYNYLKGQKSGNHADLYTVALKYKF